MFSDTKSTGPKESDRVKSPNNRHQNGEGVEISGSPKFWKGVLHAIRNPHYTPQLEAEGRYLASVVKSKDKEIDRLTYENTHDDLTGLKNKKAFKADVKERQKAGKPFAILFFDLDGFKLINDELGHDKGDTTLIETAGTIKDCGEMLESRFRREGDVTSHEKLVGKEVPASRWGGDEFALIVDLSGGDRRGDQTLAERMESQAEFARTIMDEFVKGQHETVRALRFNVSMGYAVWDPDNPVEEIELFRQADQSMYEDKRARAAQQEDNS